MTRLLQACAAIICALGAIGVCHAQAVTCQNAQYAPTIVSKYPNLPKSCLDIVTRNGEPYAVVKAELDRVYSNNELGIRVKKSDGSYAHRQTIKTDPDLRVLIDGKPTRVRDLATGQELTAYVRVGAPAIALAPAEESTPLQSTPLQETPTQQVAAALPETASTIPLLGLAGCASVLLGALLMIARHRRR